MNLVLLSLLIVVVGEFSESKNFYSKKPDDLLAKCLIFLILSYFSTSTTFPGPSIKYNFLAFVLPGDY